MGTKLENRWYDIANISISVGIFIYRNLSCEYDKQRVLQMFPWLCVFKAFWVPDDNHRHITNNRRKCPVCVCHCCCLLLFFFISFIFSPHFDHVCLQWTGSPNSSKNRAHCLPINTEDGPFDPIKCQDNNNRKFWNSQRQSAIFRSIYQKIIMRAAQQLMLISISVWITISQSIDIIGHGKLNYRTTNTQIVCVCNLHEQSASFVVAVVPILLLVEDGVGEKNLFAERITMRWRSFKGFKNAVAFVLFLTSQRVCESLSSCECECFFPPLSRIWSSIMVNIYERIGE